jgi:hypothetical protein
MPYVLERKQSFIWELFLVCMMIFGILGLLAIISVSIYFIIQRIKQYSCQPDCKGKVCGDDKCKGSCGPCAADSSCVNGQCVANAVDWSDSSKQITKNKILLVFNKQNINTSNLNIENVIECALKMVITHYKSFEDFINDKNMEETLVEIVIDCINMFDLPPTWSADFKNKFVDNLTSGSATRKQAVCILEKIINKYPTPLLLMQAIKQQCESKDSTTCPEQFLTDFIANSGCIKNVSDTGCSAKTLSIHQKCLKKPDLCVRYKSLAGCMGLNGWQGDGDTTDCGDYIKKTGEEACLY